MKKTKAVYRAGGGVSSTWLTAATTFRSAITRTTTAARSVSVDTTNGTRGSTPRSAMPRYGAAAPATAVPVSTSVESQGTAGLAACLPRRAQGGERRAEEVTAQTTIAARSSAGL